MNRRSVLTGIAGLFSWPFIRSSSASTSEISQRTDSVPEDSPNPTRLVVYFEPMTEGYVARVVGSFDDKAKFHDAWQTFMWPDWKTSSFDDARKRRDEYLKHIGDGDDVLFWLGCKLDWHYEAVMYALNRCGVECLLIGSLGKEYYDTESQSEKDEAMHLSMQNSLQIPERDIIEMIGLPIS